MHMGHDMAHETHAGGVSHAGHEQMFRQRF